MYSMILRQKVDYFEIFYIMEKYFDPTLKKKIQLIDENHTSLFSSLQKSVICLGVLFLLLLLIICIFINQGYSYLFQHYFKFQYPPIPLIFQVLLERDGLLLLYSNKVFKRHKHLTTSLRCLLKSGLSIDTLKYTVFYY